MDDIDAMLICEGVAPADQGPYSLWTELSHIPIDQHDCIDVSWRCFDKGTTREEIWHWFEDKFDLSVATDLMGYLKEY